MNTPLTKERIEALEKSIYEYEIIDPTILDLIAYWKSQQPKESKNWKEAPISRTCEVNLGGVCGKPTAYAYKAHRRGWMALCDEHGTPHIPYCTSIDALIEGGGIFEQ